MRAPFAARRLPAASRVQASRAARTPRGRQRVCSMRSRSQGSESKNEAWRLPWELPT